MNAASRIPPTLPGGAIARGALFNIYGVRLASATGATVALTRPGVSLPIKIKSMNARTLVALMPASAPLGTSALVATVDGRVSKPFSVHVTAMSPGIFSRNQEGWGQGSIENIDSSGRAVENSLDRPAHPGQKASLLATGLGGAKTVGIVIGNRSTIGAVTVYGEGEERITFVIPKKVQTGCWVPLYLMAAPNRASNVVTISIRSDRGPCDQGFFPLWSSKRSMVVALSRTRIPGATPGQPDVVSDDAKAAIRSAIEKFEPPRHALLPPAGTCTQYTGSAQFEIDLRDSLVGIAVADSAGLDAGSTLQLSQDSPKPDLREMHQAWNLKGKYNGYLGMHGMNARGRLPGLFLEPGSYHLEGAGGSQVGRIRMDFSIPQPPDWIDFAEKSVVNRSGGLTLHWKNAEQQRRILILASATDPITTASAVCICTERPEADQFTIPSTLLENFPESVVVRNRHFDDLRVASVLVKGSATAPASGLDVGTIFFVYDTRRFIEYR